MSLGENIRAARKRKDWSQRELAAKTDLEASYIQRIETGKANPSIQVMSKIADALEVSIDELVNRQGAEVHIQDAGFVEKLRLIDSLEEGDRDALIRVIDIALTKHRMRKLLDGEMRAAAV